MEIRCARPQDVDAIAHLEAVCFPEAEAATRESIRDRVKAYPNHFFLLWDGDRLVSFVNGLVTDQPDLTDEMYEKADMHQEDGAWQMIFGVDTDPTRRKQGLAGKVLEKFIDAARAEGRRGVVLTCKDRLVHYYARSIITPGSDSWMKAYPVPPTGTWYGIRCVLLLNLIRQKSSTS